MAIFEFRRNACVEIDGCQYNMHRRIDGNDGKLWQLEEKITGRLLEHTVDELLEMLRIGKLTYANEAPCEAEPTPSTGQPKKQATSKAQTKSRISGVWNAASEGAKEAARRAKRYVDAVAGLPRTARAMHHAIGQVARDRKDLHAPGASTVKEWVMNFVQGGSDITALLPRHKAKGNRTPRIDRRLADLLDTSVDEKYLTPERPTLQDTLDDAIVRVGRENRLVPKGDPQLPLPSIRMLKSLLQRRDPYEVLVCRYGRAYAEHKLRASLGHVRADHGLERVEIDHTPVNALVIDETTFLPLGRPWLTAALDVRHRVCLGYALSFEPPSWLSVMRCLQHAILPKTYVSQRYPKIKGRWDCYGLMQQLATDHGKDLETDSIRDFADRYAITLFYCPAARPWWKAKVERFLGTINRGVAHGAPGTTFADILDRADYDSAKHACLTLAALHEMIHTWVIDYYHQRVHKTLGMSPGASWQQDMGNRPIPLPTSAIELEAELSVPFRRTLTHKGIELDYLFYNSAAANDLLKRAGGPIEVDVHAPPGDLGHLFVLDPREDIYVQVPVVERFATYATGLTRWQHMICRRYAEKHFGGRNDVVALAEAKERICDIAQDQLRLKKGSAKKRAARFTQTGASAMPQGAPPRPAGPGLPVKSKPVATTPMPTSDLHPLPDASISYVKRSATHRPPRAA